MKKLLKSIVISFVVLYMITAFVKADFNPFAWNQTSREMLALLGCIGSLFLFFRNSCGLNSKKIFQILQIIKTKNYGKEVCSKRFLYKSILVC